MPHTCDRPKVVDFKQDRGYTKLQSKCKLYTGTFFDKWDTFLLLLISNWVYEIPFWFVNEFIIGSIQFNKDFHKIIKRFQVTPLELYNTKCVFQETSKGLNKIPFMFYVKPAKSEMKYQLGFIQNQS